MRRPVKLYTDKKGFYLLSKSGKKVYLETDLNFKQLQNDIIQFYKQSRTNIKKRKYKKRLYRKKPITQQEISDEQRRKDTSSTSSTNTGNVISRSSIPPPIGQKDILYMTDTEKQEPYLLRIKQLEQALFTNTDTSGNIDRDFKRTITDEIRQLSDKTKIGESVIKDMINKSYNEDIRKQTEDQQLKADKKLNVRSSNLGRKLIPPLKTYNLDEWATLSGSKRQYLNMKWRKELDKERAKSVDTGGVIEEKNATYDMLREQAKGRTVNETEGEMRLTQRLEDEINDDIEKSFMDFTTGSDTISEGTLSGSGQVVYKDGENEYIQQHENLSFLPVIFLEQIKYMKIKNEEPTYFIIIGKNGNYTAIYIDKYDCCIYDPLGENDKDIRKEVLDLCLDMKHYQLRKIKYNTKRNNLCFDTGFCCIKFLEKMLNGESFKTATTYNNETEKHIEQYV